MISDSATSNSGTSGSATYGAGSVAITARRAGARTILERVRYDGISRCSRGFRRGDAALVVLSQLGPGVVRGDSVSTTGSLRSGAHLIVTNQTATRLMGGARQSQSRAAWSLEENAILELVGEPLVAAVNARHEASTTVNLGGGSVLLLSDVTCVSAGADVRIRTSVRQFGRELFYDAFDAAAAAPQTVGTFALVGLDAACIAPVLAALDRASDDLCDTGAGDELGAMRVRDELGAMRVRDRFGDVRVGVGALPTGAFARVLAADTWTVRAALIAVRRAAWSALRANSFGELESGKPGSGEVDAGELEAIVGTAG